MRIKRDVYFLTKDGELIMGGDVNPRLIELYEEKKDESYRCIINLVEFITPNFEIAQMLKKECEELLFPGSKIEIESAAI